MRPIVGRQNLTSLACRYFVIPSGREGSFSKKDFSASLRNDHRETRCWDSGRPACWGTVLICLLLICSGFTYQLALPGRKITFPEDHYSHPNFKTEWWYYTGHLESESGKRYGYQVTFFRFGLRDRQREAKEKPQFSELYMSEKLGPMTFGKKEEEIFLGRDFTQKVDYSESTAIEIDAEVRRIIQDSYHKAKELLKTNLRLLHKVAESLLEKEVLDGSEIDAIVREFGGNGGDPLIPSAAAAVA